MTEYVTVDDEKIELQNELAAYKYSNKMLCQALDDQDGIIREMVKLIRWLDTENRFAENNGSGAWSTNHITQSQIDAILDMYDENGERK